MASIRFCPRCFSTETRRSHRRGWERLVPFVSARRCRACGERFLRGGRPPYACCPRCGGSQVQAVGRDRVPKRILNGLRSLMGGRAYRCPNCRLHFIDMRARRPHVEE